MKIKNLYSNESQCVPLFASIFFRLAVIFCLMASLSVSASFDVPKAVSQQNCNTVLEQVEAIVESTGENYLDLSQAQRLHHVLNSISPQERSTLFKSLNFENKMAVARALREWDDDSIKVDEKDVLPDFMESALIKNPSLKLFFLDMLEFGDNFPGILGHKNGDGLIMSLLDSVQKKEILDTVNHPDILKTSSMANRLRWSIDQMLVNMIRQGNNEYDGIYTFQRPGWWKRRYYSVRRWFFPTHDRAAYLVEVAQFFQKQLQRYRMIDRLIIQEALGEAIELKLTEEEVDELAQIVLDSPEEINAIEQAFKDIFHPSFAANEIVRQGAMDIYGAYKRAKKVDYTSLLNGYDDTTEDSLKKLNKILSGARERVGKKERTIKDHKKKELRLYFGVYSRGVDRNEREWDHWVNKNSNERYRVEDRKTRRVPNGKDKNGRTKYRTETYYVWRTVRPDFEDIIHDSYDRGDRGVRGLSDIRERVKAMSEKERAYSYKIEELEDYMNNLIENYKEIAMSGDQTPIEMMKTTMFELIEDMKELDDYMNWSEDQILAQYSNDKIENFKNRNREMFERYENMYRLMLVVSEQMRRGELQLLPAFDLMDYTDWLWFMRQERNSNYWQKGIIGFGSAATGISYMAFPEFQTMVDSWVRDLRTEVRSW